MARLDDVMFSLAGPALDASSLAVATTIHLGMAALRNHRHAVRLDSLALVSLLLAALPWMFPSAAGVAAGLVAHLAWFGICERLAPAPRAAAPSSPARPAATAAKVSAPSPLKPKGFVQAPVLAVFQESAEIRTYRMVRPEGFKFVPGQFLAVRLHVDDRDVVRCYSISSAPEASGYLEISVRRQGLVSTALHASLRPGSLLSIRAPAGAFTYPANDDRPLVLIAGGVGITPLMSMLRHAVLAEPTRPVTLLYSAQREGDFAFRDEIVQLARRHTQLRVCLAVSRGTTLPNLYSGRIDASLLKVAVPEIAHAICLMCGPQSMIADLSRLLQELGVPKPQVRFELFEAAVASSSRPVDEGGETRHVGGDRSPGSAYRLRAVTSGREVRVAAGQTLLEAADAHGIEIASLCRAGVCGTCRTRVVEGEVSCDSSVLDDEDRAAGYVLACVAAPQGDCAIEA